MGFNVSDTLYKHEANKSAQAGKTPAALEHQQAEVGRLDAAIAHTEVIRVVTPDSADLAAIHARPDYSGEDLVRAIDQAGGGQHQGR